MCDDLRQENNGKLLVIGMYTGGMTVPQFPFQLPILTFFSVLEADRLGNHTLRVKIENAETGRVIAQQIVMMDVNTMPTNPVPLAVAPKFVGLTFEAGGAYTMSMTIDGQVDPVVVFPFNVVLVIPAVTQPH